MQEMNKVFPNLRVISVPKSTSKADNINYFLKLPDTTGDIITIFDTDHYPARQALKWVARAFNKGDVDIIQGRCCIYNYSETWITRLIAAEFDSELKSR
jgi:cellulose synthase/poly-beta-1,6-N-acetylglucosamine synthase-like glycosyltransferase